MEESSMMKKKQGNIKNTLIMMSELFTPQNKSKVNGHFKD